MTTSCGSGSGPTNFRQGSRRSKKGAPSSIQNLSGVAVLSTRSFPFCTSTCGLAISFGDLVTRRADSEEPRPTAKGLETGAVSELHGIARFRFRARQSRGVKRLCAKCAEIARTNDTGILQYATSSTRISPSASSTKG